MADDIKLVCDLYRIYVQCTGSTETLDHFYGWGMLMLSDFDDIDKNLADATDVFRNLSNIHELDDVSYLTDEQREALKRFFSNFSDDYNSELKKRFLQLWQNFGDIYNRYNAHLQEEGLAYEGALYREVACNENVSFDAEAYVFVGFNMLQKVEQKLFARLERLVRPNFIGISTAIIWKGPTTRLDITSVNTSMPFPTSCLTGMKRYTTTSAKRKKCSSCRPPQKPFRLALWGIGCKTTPLCRQDERRPWCCATRICCKPWCIVCRHRLRA